jgi:hypothetical protein
MLDNQRYRGYMPDEKLLVKYPENCSEKQKRNLNLLAKYAKWLQRDQQMHALAQNAKSLANKK